MEAARVHEASYLAIARDLRELILRGAFAHGRALPTEADLASDYAVSRQTVRRAFHDLVSEGMVYRVRGRGTFAQINPQGYVRQIGSVDDLMGMSADDTAEIIEPLTRHVDPASAGRLRLASDFVYTLHFVRIHGGVQFCTTRVHLPPQVYEVLERVDELHRVGSVSSLNVVDLLNRRLHHPIVEATQSITVGAIPATEAATLAVPTGSVTLRIDRVYRDTRGDVVVLTISQFLAEHYSYRTNLRLHGR